MANVTAMLQKPLCGNQMNLVTLKFNIVLMVTDTLTRRMGPDPFRPNFNPV